MKSLFLMMFGAVAITVYAEMPRLPETIALSPEGTTLAIGEPDGRHTFYTLAGEPTASSYVPCNAKRSPEEDKQEGIFSTLSKDGKWIYRCNRFANRVMKLDAQTLQVVSELPANREPIGVALGAEDKLLFVANHLPEQAIDPKEVVASVITVIDTETFTKKGTLLLPDGSTSLRGIAASPDGKHLYVTHVMARYRLPTTQVERGWMNTAALTVLDGTKGTYINTILLDDIDAGAANPWGVSVSPDGKRVVVAHAGSREISIIDREALMKRLTRAARGRKVTAATDSAEDVPNDFSFLSGIRRRVNVEVPGVRGIVATNEAAYAAAYYAGAVVKVPFDETLSPSVLPLDKAKGVTDLKQYPELYGEMLFNDASLCFQQWQSCATCHPDGRVDGLNWDLMNDGMGNPKQTKSLLYAAYTPPTMITGIRADMAHCNRAGFRHIQFVKIPEDVQFVDVYTTAMRPQPSPVTDKEAIARGKKIFEKADCARCHTPEHYYTAAVNPKDHTQSPLYDIGLGVGEELGRLFDVPTLHEVWRTGPYLYDGRAKTILEVLTIYNEADQHGITQDLTPEELADLNTFLLSL